jgi:hypothetical protein
MSIKQPSPANRIFLLSRDGPRRQPRVSCAGGADRASYVCAPQAGLSNRPCRAERQGQRHKKQCRRHPRCYHPQRGEASLQFVLAAELTPHPARDG